MKPFPTLEDALGCLMVKIMGEALSADTPAERLEQLDAVRAAIKAAWPKEIKEAAERTVFSYGGRAMFADRRQEATPEA